MSALVADASVLVAAVTAGPLADWALGQLAVSEVVAAPHLVLVEAANALRRARGAKQLSPAAAAAAHRDLLELDLALMPYAPFAERIWELTAGVTAYDAWYVAVAERFGAPLATVDRRLARASGPRCEFRLPG